MTSVTFTREDEHLFKDAFEALGKLDERYQLPPEVEVVYSELRLPVMRLHEMRASA